MVIKVHGPVIATCTKRVLVVLEEKNVPYELIEVDVPGGEHKKPAYVTNQPFGLVPYIDDDGFILFESRAICRYIAEKYRDSGTPLVPDPKDLKATALYEQASSIEQNYFEPFATGVVMETFFKS
jgi:glutathione S-transferase